MMYQRIILLLFLATLCLGINAQIQIESVFNPGIDRSNGYINVQAVGSAEPFRIELWRGDAKVAETPTTYINGVYSFRDLPAGIYTIKFWDRLNCITQLEQVLIEEYFCDIAITLVAFKHSTHFYTGECVIPNSDEGYTAGETEDGVLEIVVRSNESTRVEWKGPGGFTSDALRIENLEAGFYEVTVYDIGDASCKSKVEYSVYYCEERHGGCDGDLISFYEGYHNGTNQESPLDFEISSRTSPSGMACNGALEMKVEVAANYGSEYYYSYWLDEQTGVTYNTLLLENLCPGEYTFHLLDGCNQEKTETYTLVDCDIDPLVVEEVNLCRDPRYTDFPITFNGGVGSQILGPYEEGNTVRYVIQDERGCTVEKVFTYAYIDDFDFTVELVKPRTLYSAPIVIVNLEDYDPLYGPYLLFQNGLKYPLEPNQPNEIILTEGTDGINRFILQNAIGCELVKDIDLMSCSEAEEIRLTTRIDYENDGVLSQVDRRSQCNDHSYLHLSIEGGEPNYRIRIESLTGDPWLYEEEISEETDKYRIDQALPNVPIGITILDECEHRIYTEIEPCDDCDFTYQNNGDTGGVFHIGNDGGIEIRVNNPCGIFDFNPFRNTSIEMKISSYQVADWELPITVEWPNGDRSVITRNSEGELSLSEKSIKLQNEDDAGPQVVKITRGDGCVIELPIEIKESKTTFGSFEIATTEPPVYIGARKCTKCNGLSEDAQYLDESECSDSKPEWFEYNPISMDAPCDGGELKIHYYDNELQDWQTETITIHPGDAIGETLAPFNGLCSTYGTCLFSSSISGAIGPGSIPIAASFCIDEDAEVLPDVCAVLNCEAEGLVCNGDGECVEPCDPSVVDCDEDCEYGVCLTYLKLCDISFSLANTNGESIDLYIPHNLPIGTRVTMKYNTLSIPDRITLTQDGIGLDLSGKKNGICESTLHIEYWYFEILSDSPIRLEVDASSCSTRVKSEYYISFNCG